jgi:D-glycero-D-manno-heptose 1,7-bisphosphate phosphatase
LWGVSNQGGVAAGHKSLDSCFEEMAYTLQIFSQLEGISFCPDYEGRKLWGVNFRNICARYDQSDFYPDLIGTYRKPGPGMLEFVVRSLGPQDAVMVGDRPEDEAAAAAAGIGFIPAKSWRSGVEYLPGGSVIA